MTGSKEQEAVDGSPLEADSVLLTEPVRQRLIAIAAEVLAKLPYDQVPPTLRSIAKFVPSRRIRLGGAALSVALDSDERFRDKVAEAVADAQPHLVAALREHRETTASDPIDVAAVAYLVRPEGWTDEIRGANERWRAERESSNREAVSAEVDRLRAEVAEARSQLRSEAQRSRAEVAAARTESADEIADLRKQLRSRTGELRAAERARDDALGTAAQLQQRVEAAESSRDAELRKLRARTEELERAVESARRGARTERELDDMRLWLLVETLTGAAAGIRRELSLNEPAARPADAVESAEPSALTYRVKTVAQLGKVLALPNVHLIVDGYNVTKTGYGELTLADQRKRLIGALAPLAASSGLEVTIAFDGGQRPPILPPTPRGVRVLFSAPDEIADDLIRRLVGAEPPGRPIAVVTSDQEVASDVRRANAWSVPSALLLQRLSQ